MAEKYVGKFNRVSTENLDEFFKELGLNVFLRTAIAASNPVLEVGYEPMSETWTFKVSTILRSNETKFKLGVEFDHKMPDGRDVRILVTKAEDKFTEIQTTKNEGEKCCKVVREFRGDEVVQTSNVIGSDLICTQIFKRQ